MYATGDEGRADTGAEGQANAPAKDSSAAEQKDDRLPFDLPPGHLAVTLRAAEDSALAGLFLPGARVDLITVVPDPEHPTHFMAKGMLENLLVLHNQCPPPEGTKLVSLSAILTVAVKPEEVARLAEVSRDGGITAALVRPERNGD